MPRLDVTDLNLDDLEPITINTQYLGRSYVIKEASGDVVARWKNMMAKEVRMRDGSVVGLNNVADFEPILVSMCLFENTGSQEKPVPVVVIRSWPNRVVTRIFETVKSISGLDDDNNVESLDKKIKDLQDKRAALLRARGDGEEQDSEKNEQPPTTGGCD